MHFDAADDCLPLALAGDVVAYEACVSVRGADRGGDFLAVLNVGENDGSALASEHFGAGAADAASCGASDQRYLS